LCDVDTGRRCKEERKVKVGSVKKPTSGKRCCTGEGWLGGGAFQNQGGERGNVAKAMPGTCT